MKGATRVPFACGVVLTALAGAVGGGVTARAAEPVIEPPAPEGTAPPVEKTPASPGATPTFAGDARVFPALEPPSLSHERQVGLAVFAGSGFRVLFPYQEQIYCGQIGKRVCSGRQPAFLDLQGSYGFGAHWDVLAELRLGLE